MALGKPVFTNKTYGAQLYKWSPLPSDRANTKANSNSNSNKRPFYCTAIAGSQGQDWITTYCYDLIVINSQQEHLAYVECNYVE
jgi:hypothetical protein